MREDPPSPLQQAVDALPTPFYCKDEEGRILACNPAFIRLTGKSREEVLGKTAFDLFPEETALPIRHSESKVLATGRSEQTEVPLQQGKERLALVLTNAPMKDRKGTVGMLLDVTDQKWLNIVSCSLADWAENEVSLRMQSQRELEIKEELFATIFQMSGIGIAMVDAAGNYAQTNRAFEEIFGYQAGELEGRRFSLVYPEEERSRMEGLHASCVGGCQERETMESEMVDREGNRLWVYSTVVHVTDARGRDYMVLSVRDMTEVKKLDEGKKEQEQLLIQNAKMAAMGEMVGNIAHQWRQPLNVLGAILFNIKAAYAGNKLTPELVERYYGDGRKLLEKMSTTIDDFRNFFRPSRARRTFRAGSVVKDTLSIISASMEFHHIRVETDLQDNPELSGFSGEFSQMLLNLLSNAKDALSAIDGTRRVRVSLREEEGFAILEVEDNGPGIPPELASKIFDSYFTTKGEEKGTGIGLYMSRIIVESRMHGTIALVPGKKGARFRVRVPIAPPFEGQEESSPPPGIRKRTPES